MAIIGGALEIGGAILVCIGVKLICDRKTQKIFNDHMNFIHENSIYENPNYKKMIAMQEAIKNHENKTDENQSEEAE